MKVFHGTNIKGIKEFCFDGTKVCKREGYEPCEGWGIYATASIDFARGYGNAIYEIDLNTDRELCNFYELQHLEEIEFFRRQIEQELSFISCDLPLDLQNIEYNLYLDYFTAIGLGTVSITDLANQIALMIDSDEYMYNKYEAQLPKIYQTLSNFIDRIDWISYVDQQFFEIVYLIRSERAINYFEELSTL